MNTSNIKDEMPLVVSAKSPDSRWVALDNNNAIISEGKTPNEAIQEAKKVTDDFALMFVPVEGNTYIF